MGSGLVERRRPPLAAIAGASLGVGLVAVSVVTLGAPDLAMAWSFLAGAYPSTASVVAFLSLVCYAVVGSAALVAVVVAVRAAVGERSTRRAARRRGRSAWFVVAGLALLGLSVVNRVETGSRMCCGAGPQQVQEAAALAR